MHYSAQKLDNLFRCSAFPVFAVADGMVVYLNGAAERFFPEPILGRSAAEMLSHWPYESGSVVSVTMLGKDCVLSVSEFEELLVLTADAPLIADAAALPDGAIADLAASLATLRLAADRLASRCPSDSETEQCAEILYHNYYKILRTTEHLRTISGLASGQLLFTPRPVELGAFLSDLVSAVRHLTADTGVTLEYEPPAALITVQADAGLLEQMVLNLLSNSFQHTGPGNHVFLGLGHQRDQVTIRVRDDGAGIPPEKQTALFQYGSRREASQLPAPGSGLGLALAAEAARRHGGALVLTSAPGAGTTVCVRLQCADRTASGLGMPSPPYGSQLRTRALTELSVVLPSSAYGRDKMSGE